MIHFIISTNVIKYTNKEQNIVQQPSNEKLFFKPNLIIVLYYELKMMHTTQINILPSNDCLIYVLLIQFVSRDNEFCNLLLFSLKYKFIIKIMRL